MSTPRQLAYPDHGLGELLRFVTAHADVECVPGPDDSAYPSLCWWGCLEPGVDVGSRWTHLFHRLRDGDARQRAIALRPLVLQVPLIAACLLRFGARNVPCDLAQAFFGAAGYAAGGPAYDAATWYLDAREVLGADAQSVDGWPLLESVDGFEGAESYRSRWVDGSTSVSNALFAPSTLRGSESPDFSACRRCGASFNTVDRLTLQSSCCTPCTRLVAQLLDEVVWCRVNGFRPVARASCSLCLTPMVRKTNARACSPTCRHVLRNARLSCARPARAMVGRASLDSPSRRVASGPAPSALGDVAVSESRSDAAAHEERLVAEAATTLSSPGWTSFASVLASSQAHSDEAERVLEALVRDVDSDVALVRRKFQSLGCAVSLQDNEVPAGGTAAALAPSQRSAPIRGAVFGWSVRVFELPGSVSLTPLDAHCDVASPLRSHPLWAVRLECCSTPEAWTVFAERVPAPGTVRLLRIPDGVGDASDCAVEIGSLLDELDALVARFARCLASRCDSSSGQAEI